MQPTPLLERAQAATAAIRSDPESARKALAEILAAAGPDDGKARATALMAQAILHHRDSNHAGTLQACREALALARTFDDFNLAARSLNLLGLCHHALADDRAAVEHFQEADRMAEKAGDDVMRNMALANVAMVMHSQGDLESALEVYRRLVATPKVQAIPQVIAQTRHNLAQTLWDMKRDLLECAELFALAAEGKRALGDHWSLALTLCSLSGVWRDLGEFAKARAVLAEVAAILPEKPAPELTNLYRLNLGVWLSAEKNPDRDLTAAQQELELALESARASALKEYEARCLEYLAKARIAAGKFAEACADLELVAELRQEIHTDESRRRIDRLRVAFEAERAQSDANHERQLREEAEAFTARIQEQNHRLENLNREKSDIIGLIAHDLRAPLAGAVELTGEVLAAPHDQANVIGSSRALLTAQKQMLRLIQSLLDIENLESGTLPVEPGIVEFADFFIELQRARTADITGKNLTVTGAPSPTAQYWHGPVLLLEHAVENLFSNAVKYTPSGRQITLSTALTAAGLEVRVSDTGPGIAPAKRERMFKKFATLGSAPTGGESAYGLGLYLAQSCARHAGGSIRYEDTPGGGATFVLALPQVNPVASGTTTSV